MIDLIRKGGPSIIGFGSFTMDQGARKRIERYISDLRELEKAAEEEPGRSMDFEHEPSEEYTKYDEAFLGLRDLMADLSLPSGWIWMAEWFENRDHLFGDVEAEAWLRWFPEERSVYTLILEDIRRHLNTRKIREGEEGIWTDPRTARFISDTDWSGKGGEGDGNIPCILVEVVHLMGRDGDGARKGLDPDLAVAVDLLDRVGNWLSIGEVRMWTEDKKIVLDMDVDMDLPVGKEVGIYMARLEEGGFDYIKGTDFQLVRSGKGLVGRSEEGGPRVRVKDGGILVYKSKGGWAPWKEVPGSRVGVWLDTRIPEEWRDALPERYFKTEIPRVLYLAGTVEVPEPA